ncbi:hypothetical protein DTO280E4_4218 [Paecilomyces variotii]|nr:hypothetical protein DTO280E4_4218 [Paecilomyces variotii]
MCFLPVVKSALGLERPISADDKTCALLNHDDSFPSVRSVATGLLQHHEADGYSQIIRIIAESGSGGSSQYVGSSLSPEMLV